MIFFHSQYEVSFTYKLPLFFADIRADFGHANDCSMTRISYLNVIFRCNSLAAKMNLYRLPQWQIDIKQKSRYKR